MLLGLTLMHDADLCLDQLPALATRHKYVALQHWNLAMKSFNQILAQPIPPSYRDAIWATGVYIGAASFWYVESTHIEEAWPLKPSEPGDLLWMKHGEGKQHLLQIADPTRPDSVFHEVIKTHGPCNTPPEWITRNDISRIPPCLQHVFGITSDSTPVNNVYYLPVLILSHIQDMHLTHQNAQTFLYITSLITSDFLSLLEAKDAGAVFVIGWWFKLVQDGKLWWMVRRAVVEGQAVRLWLRKHNDLLADLLDSLV